MMASACWCGFGIRIAMIISYYACIINRELHRNMGFSAYRPQQAQHLAKERRQSAAAY